MSGSFVVGPWHPADDRSAMRPHHAILAESVDDNIAIAAGLILAGELVAFPTETVYGLGGDATNDRAVARIFEAKGRPRFNPLIVHFHDPAATRTRVRFDARADALAAAFWPGPLTLVLPRSGACDISLLASAGLQTLAVRVPAHLVARRLLAACGTPIAAPSANVSGRISPTTAAHVQTSLGGKVAMILDGGRCQHGIESTVVDLSTSEARLLRHGAVTEEELAATIGPVADATGIDTAQPGAPGMMASHYAPERPLRLHASRLEPREALLAFGPRPLAGAAAIENLSPDGDLVEAAANLFAMLRSLDRPEYSGIAVMPVPDRGLGRAINDRLKRAAAPR